MISISVQRLTCPRQHPYGPSHGGWYPASYPRRPAKVPAITPRGSCRLSATGVRFLSILFLPGTSALLTVGLPGSAWTLAGFPRSAHPSHGRIGCPLYPEAKRCSHGRSDPSGRRSPPLPGARPYHPGVPSISRDCLLRGVIKGSLAFTRPAFPLACNPRMERGLLGLAPRASHPAGKTCGARLGGGRASSTHPELHDRHYRTSNS